MIHIFWISLLEYQVWYLTRKQLRFLVCIVFSNLLDQFYKSIDMPFYKIIESL